MLSSLTEVPPKNHLMRKEVKKGHIIQKECRGGRDIKELIVFLKEYLLQNHISN